MFKNLIGILIFILGVLLSLNSYANYVIVDFSLPSTKKRLFIYNNNNKLLLSTYVAHGIASGDGIYATRFSNVFGSKASSLGAYKVNEVYYGKHGKVYRVTGLDMSNSNAYMRYIEIHGAGYIGHGKTGHSFGCFAVPFSAMPYIFKFLKPGDKLIAKD